MMYLMPEAIASNQLYVVPDATLYHFGVIQSNVHMAWCGLCVVVCIFSISCYGTVHTPSCRAATYRRWLTATPMATAALT